MKICTKCQVERPLAVFPRKRGTRGTICNECQRTYTRKHYLANKAEYLKRNKIKRERLRQFLRNLKEAAPCPDCGVRYPYYVMEFDHQRDKLFNVGEYAANNNSWRVLKEEIAKCEIVCANCHRLRTYKEEPPDANLLAVC